MSKNEAKPREEKQAKNKHENIYAALAAFQGEMKPLKKSATVEFETKGGQKVKYSYTPLGEMMEVLYPLLGKHGLSVRHVIQKIEGKDYIEAVVSHESYQMVVLKMDDTHSTIEQSNTIGSGPVKIFQGDDMKDIGAAITYAKRYSLGMVLGLSSEDDQDAQLFMESAKNAVDYAYDRFKKGLEEAKAVKDIEKAMTVLGKEIKQVEEGKAGALGLSKEQYQELIMIGEKCKAALSSQAPAEGGTK